MTYKEIAGFLFRLLEDIGTASEVAKADDKAYRKFVEKHLERRLEVAESSGYMIDFSKGKNRFWGPE